MHVPLPLPRLSRFYKVSKRVMDDISSVAGAFALDLDGAGRVERYGEEHLGVPAVELATVAKRQAQSVEDAEAAGEPMPELEFPTI